MSVQENIINQDWQGEHSICKRLCDQHPGQLILLCTQYTLLQDQGILENRRAWFLCCVGAKQNGATSQRSVAEEFFTGIILKKILNLGRNEEFYWKNQKIHGETGY